MKIQAHLSAAAINLKRLAAALQSPSTLRGHIVERVAQEAYRVSEFSAARDLPSFSIVFLAGFRVQSSTKIVEVQIARQSAAVRE